MSAEEWKNWCPVAADDRARPRGAARVIVRTLLVVLVLSLLAAGGWYRWLRPDPPPVLSGLVVTATGAPIPGATVVTPDGRTVARTGVRGGFAFHGADTWVTVSAPGWIPRTRVVSAGQRTVVRLVKDEPGTITMTFGGDVMFGRRFFDPDENGSNQGILTPGSSTQDLQSLLSGVAPLLDTADLTVVNLETPLARHPNYDIHGPRPAAFHPTKEYAFASPPAAAEALKNVGVDAVDLGNNHVYDRLARGVTSTRDALRRAGLAPETGSFGAGADANEAWQPAIQHVRGQTVALLGCTTVQGVAEPILYTATADKGGAADCQDGRLERSIELAKQQADVVVVMIHGGNEYQDTPTAEIRDLSRRATAAGATLVINGHPHVTGGLDYSDGNLTAWSMGNLLFDQSVWQTFHSYLLTVAVRDSRVVGAWAEPIRLQNYQPTGIHGTDADWVSRGTLPLSSGPWVDDDGSLWLDLAGAARSARSTVKGTSDLWRLEQGCAPRAGRELLWTGDFEDRDLQPATASDHRGRASPRPDALWNATTDDPYRKWEPDIGRSGAGVMLHRASLNIQDVVLYPLHRALVAPGDRLTALVDLRADHGDPAATLQLSWYHDTKGGSQAQTVVPLPVKTSWQTFRVDAVVPRHAVAVLPIVRLSPPREDFARLEVDNVRLIDFDQPGCDYLPGRPGAVTTRALPPEVPRIRASPVHATLLPASVPLEIRKLRLRPREPVE